MADLEYVVDTDGGPGYDYLTIQAALDALDVTYGDLVGDTNTLTLTCRTYSGSADTALVDIDSAGWISNQTYYIKICTDPLDDYRHSGIWDDTKFRVTGTAEASGEAYMINVYTDVYDEGVIIDGLQVKVTCIGNAYSAEGILFTTDDPSAAVWFEIINNIVVGVRAGYNPDYFTGIEPYGAGGPLDGVIANNIIYGFDYSGGDGYGIWLDQLNSDNWAAVYNNTIVGCGIGIARQNPDDAYGYNNLVQDCTYADYITDYSWTGSAANAASDNTSPNVGYDYITANFVGGIDYRLLPTDDEAQQASTSSLYSDSRYPITTDIAGTSRGTSSATLWDIGAHHPPIIERIVDPDTGAGYHYTTLNAWELAVQQDLVVNNKIALASCRSTSGSNDTTATDISGWTTSSGEEGNYIKVWTPTEYRHQGYWDDTKYSLELTGSTAALLISEDHVRVEGIQVAYNDGGTGEGGIVTNSPGAGSVVFIDKCIVQATGTTQTASYTAGIYHYTGTTGNPTMVVRNCIVYDFNQDGEEPCISAFGMGDGSNAATAYLYNNTFIDCDYCVCAYDNTNIYMANNIFNNATGYLTYITGSAVYEGWNIYDNLSDYVDNLLTYYYSGCLKRISGENTGTATNKLIDSSEDFSDVPINAIVTNSTVGYIAYVTAIDSSIQLSLSSDIFASYPVEYDIYQSFYGSPTFQNEASNIFLLDSTDTLARDNGADLSEEAYGFTTDILGNIRGV